jgi:hypothetical protein
MNIIDTVKHKEDAIILRDNSVLPDISLDVLGESSFVSSLAILNG